MQRLDIILFVFLLQSCNGNGQSKSESKKNETDLKYSIRIINDKLLVKSADSSIVYNSANLIRNFDLLNTSFYKGTSNDFFLVYQNNASNTKTQVNYHLLVKKNNIFLISKEQVGLNGNSIFITKNYIIPTNVTNMDYETMDSKITIENNKSFIISKNTLTNSILFNSKNAFELTFNYKANDFFMDYPVNTLKRGKISFLDINNSNDIAYYLEESQIYDEAIIILENIIKKEPTRVVAYLNLGDSYWGLGNVEDAKKSYSKYITLMKSQNKDLKKIPMRVYERVK